MTNDPRTHRTQEEPVAPVLHARVPPYDDRGVNDLRSRRSRGFSLLEIVIVIAIVALILTIGIPSYFAAMHRGRANQQIRMLMDDFSSARAYASTGNTMTANSAANVRSAGIRVLSARSYEIIQTDSPSGGGTGYTSPCATPPCTDVVKVVTFANESGLVFSSPSSYPSDVFFKANGTIVPGGMDTFVVRDTTNGVQKTIAISMTGSVRIQN
jgi:prepilin-type N-terminal cleavage/methylation domain-containing protein